MNDLQKHMKEAYDAISRICVNGDDVELMAHAKAQLRKAYEIAATHGGESENG